MRLSESLRKNIMKANARGILNRFKVKSRRSVLFFEDILANYIKRCEDVGYSKELEDLGYVWGSLGIEKLMPTIINALPVSIAFNLLARKIWINIGLLDDLHLSKANNIITLKTKNEGITRIIGNNNFMPAFYGGMLSALYKNKIILLKSVQNTTDCEYTLIPNDEKVSIKGKDKTIYNKLNKIKPIEGFTLKGAIQKSIFKLGENNKIYFRGRHIIFAENTIFHLLGSSKINMSSISEISYNYFSELIEKGVRKERKLNLLKFLLQSMGWGIVKIITRGQKIIIYIQNPPHGIQMETDNWDFLIHTILGYMMVINKKLNITHVSFEPNTLKMVFE